MHTFFDHPELQKMLDLNCCSEADTGRMFHLYISLCEQHRVLRVQWHCDKDLGIIYMVTGGVEEMTKALKDESSHEKYSNSSTAAETSTDKVKQEIQASPTKDTKHVTETRKGEETAKQRLDSPPPVSTTAPSDTKHSTKTRKEEKVSNECLYSAPPPFTSAQSDTKYPIETIKDEKTSKEGLDSLPASTTALEVGDSEIVTDCSVNSPMFDSQDELDDEQQPIVFISFDYEQKINHSFLVAVDTIRKKYPEARLSIVPSQYWTLLGNYMVHNDVQAEVYHSTHPGPAPSTKRDDPTPTNATLTGTETTNEECDSSVVAGSLQPGCFPEAYIVKATQQCASEENSAELRPVCFPEAYILHAKQQQQTDNSDTCNPQSGQGHHQSSDVDDYYIDTHDLCAEPSAVTDASANVESTSNSRAEVYWDTNWAGSHPPTESWD